MTSQSIDAATALFNYNQTTGNSAVQLNDGGHYDDAYLSALNYQVSAAITRSAIAFGDNATSAGPFSTISSNTTVKVTFTNTGPSAVTPILNSQIIPGGFGVYIVDPSQNPTKTGVFSTPRDINKNPQTNTSNTFNSFTPTETVNASDPNLLAGASFLFDISSDGSLIQSYAGALTIDYNPGGAPIMAYSLNALASTLTNFGQVTPADSEAAYGFQWDATSIAVPLGGPLAPGARRTLTYSTRVTAFTQGDLTNEDSLDELQAFSGFGDPIGRSAGPGESPALRLADDTLVSGLTFSRFSIGSPTFDPTTGELSFPVSPTPLSNLPLHDLTTPVPEPAAWVLWLAGVAGVGLAMRRRAARSSRAWTRTMS